MIKPSIDKNTKLLSMITDLIHLCDTLDNLYLKTQLEKIKTLIETEPSQLPTPKGSGLEGKP